MWLAGLFILAGFVVLGAGAELLVRGASALALRMGVSALVVGLTVVAFGTSSPELFVGARASLAGQGDITLGSVVGSNICNILLILGIASLLQPMKIHLQVLKFDLPIMVGITAVACLLLWFVPVLNRPIGLVLLAAVVVYTVMTIALARRETAEKTDYDDALASPTGRLWLEIVFVVAGPILLALGADFILRGAVTLAGGWGISEAVIGLTIVAVAGSLPELATSMNAALKKKGDIAVGNVVGSNIFNLLCVLGVSSLVRPIPVTGIRDGDVGFMMLITLLLVPLMRTGSKLDRREGAVMLIIYIGYVVYLFAIAPVS
jgi:cation:H+ antiporter